MEPFAGDEMSFDPPPELSLEWAVEVKSHSDGYPEASLGAGWYPDALIPLSNIQMNSSKVDGRVTYPLQLPDFHNRIEDQQHLAIWVDQYIPHDRSGAALTEEHGYEYGPGYGEPINNFVLPFDVFGKHGRPGWPDIGRPEVEREPERRATYIDAVQKVHEHMLTFTDPDQTRLITYLRSSCAC